jgi:hypothetical protein
LKRFSTSVLALCTLISPALRAQQDDVQKLISNRDHKLDAPFLKKASWATNYEDAKASAKASGKLILGYFTRSYAPCGPCLQLEQLVFDKPEFAEFSKGVVPFCHISTRIPGDPQGFLFAEKGGNAFPTLMVMDENGNVLARHCGERSMRIVRELVNEGGEFAKLIKRAESRRPVAGDPTKTEPAADLETRYSCICKQIEFGHFTPDVARAKVRDLGPLSADRKAWFEAAITSRECCLCLLDIRKASDEDGQYRAAGKLVEMKKAGHIPSDGNVFPFWEWIMSYANRNQDVALYEDGLNALKAILPDDASRRERLQQNENQLENLKREVRLGANGVVISSTR